MSNNAEEQKIKGTFELARSEISRLQPELALLHLRGIKDLIKDVGSPIEQATYSLLLAESFCAQRTEAAEPYLEEAQDKISHLPTRQMDLELRLHEQFGNFFSSVIHKPTKAREHYARAKAVAVENGVPDVTARIELKIILADLTSDRDAELANFKLLRHTGGEGHYSCAEQLAAWYLHLGEAGLSARGLRYARKFGTRDEQYFKCLLDSVRLSQK